MRTDASYLFSPCSITTAPARTVLALMEDSQFAKSLCTGREMQKQIVRTFLHPSTWFIKQILQAGAWIHSLCRGNLSAPGIYWLRKKKKKKKLSTSAASRAKLIIQTLLRERCSCQSNKVNESGAEMVFAAELCSLINRGDWTIAPFHYSLVMHHFGADWVVLSPLPQWLYRWYQSRPRSWDPGWPASAAFFKPQFTHLCGMLFCYFIYGIT